MKRTVLIALFLGLFLFEPAWMLNPPKAEAATVRGIKRRAIGRARRQLHRNHRRISHLRHRDHRLHRLIRRVRR